jgi:hypothetical protein
MDAVSARCFIQHVGTEVMPFSFDLAFEISDTVSVYGTSKKRHAD